MENNQPPYQSNVYIPFGGYVVIRFRTKQAGWWLVENMRWSDRENGVAFAIKVGRKEDMPVPPADFPTDCGKFEPPEVRTV